MEKQILRYEIGLSRLKRHIAVLGDEGLSVRLRDLEESLYETQYEIIPSDSSHVDETIDPLIELEKIAYRTRGVSFKELCSEKQSRLTHLRSLKMVLIGLICLVFFPGIGISYVAHGYQTKQDSVLREIERITHNIDAEIGAGITTPLFQYQGEPCSPTMKQFLMSTNVEIDWNGQDCVWSYRATESGGLLANDYWAGRGIWKREYFKNGNLLVEDLFDRDVPCFKRRKYFSESGDILGTQCFSEAGKPIEQIIDEGLRSPIPPPFYWLSYR